jgi:hypothetical protein
MKNVTPADEAMAITRANIQTAIVQLSKIVVERCHGTEEISDYMQIMAHEILNELINIRRKIGG